VAQRVSVRRRRTAGEIFSAAFFRGLDRAEVVRRFSPGRGSGKETVVRGEISGVSEA
jgi:hypothetical protein